jgi:hypothetical protein
MKPAQRDRPATARGRPLPSATARSWSRPAFRAPLLEPSAPVAHASLPGRMPRLSRNTGGPQVHPSAHFRRFRRVPCALLKELISRTFTGIGDPGLEPGTSSLSDLLGASGSRVRRTQQSKMAANRADGGAARRPGATSRDRSVAPTWPHRRALGRGCRSAWTRTSARRYGQARTPGRLRWRSGAGLKDRVDGREPGNVFEFVDHVAVGVERDPMEGRPGVVSNIGRHPARMACGE